MPSTSEYTADAPRVGEKGRTSYRIDQGFTCLDIIPHLEQVRNMKRDTVYNDPGFPLTRGTVHAHKEQHSTHGGGRYSRLAHGGCQVALGSRRA